MPRARILIALAVLLVMIVALVIFGALRSGEFIRPTTTKAPVVEDKAKKETEPGRSAAVTFPLPLLPGSCCPNLLPE